MRREDVRVGVVRIEGTNSEDESVQVFRELGVQAEAVHLKQLVGSDTWPGEERSVFDYQVLFFPGGFSGGDYVRAGAIFAARMKAGIGKQVREYVREGRLVLGVCNGFQILTEAGLLPNVGDVDQGAPTACLYTNDSGHYECRPSLLKHVNRGKNAFTRSLAHGEVRTFITSHGEGKFYVDPAASDRALQQLADNDQIVFEYVGPDGEPAVYPWNPNGAPGGVAGVCNREGNVFGMMPHPERVFWRHLHPDWTRTGLDVRGPNVGDGRAVFESAVEHCAARM